MQKDPKQAMLRYKDDAEVGRFLQEFGKVMSAHFDALAAQQQPKKEEAQPVPIVEEIGPLQAQAIKNKSASTSSSAVPSSSNSSANAVKGSETDEEKRVQQVRLPQ